MFIKDTIIISDLDGTVVPDSGIISQKNKDAIARFKALGGTFTIATGRTPRRASEFASELMVKGAFIAGNGSVIFDNVANISLSNICFEEESYNYIKTLIKEFPHIGVVLIDTDDKYYIVNDSETMREYTSSGMMHDITYHKLDDFPKNCRSGWLALNEDEFTEICLWIAHNKSSSLNFAVSGRCFIDILPGGISKGTMFEKLVCDIYGKSIENSVAIGDFPNDIEMIKKAQLGVAVANAHEEVKAVADIVVKSCEDDGIADLIDYLIANEK